MFGVIESPPEVMEYGEAILWTIRNVGCSGRPMFPVGMPGEKALMVEMKYLENGIRFPPGVRSEEERLSSLAVFLSARTVDPVRRDVRVCVSRAGLALVEAVFPFNLIQHGRLDDTWLAGLSCARLLASDALLFQENVGVFGLMELVLAKRMQIPIFEVGVELEKVKRSCSGEHRKNWRESLTDFGTIFDCLLKEKEWLKRMKQVDLRGELRKLTTETRSDLGGTSFLLLIERYLNKQELNLDFSLRWTKERLGIMETELVN